jgi:hypothetical protein
MAVAAAANSKPRPSTQPPNVTKNQFTKQQAAKPSPQPANSQMSRALLARWEFRLERLRNSKEESQAGAMETNRNSLKTIYKEAQEAGVYLPHPTWNDQVFNGMSLIGGKIDDEEAEAREAEGEEIELEEVEEGGATDEELEEEEPAKPAKPAKPASPPPNKKAAATITATTTSGKKGGATGKTDGQAGKATATVAAGSKAAQAAAIKKVTGANSTAIPPAQMPQATLTKKEKLRIANEEREERLAAKKAAKGEEPAAPKAKKTKAKKEVVFNPCLCGCSRQVPGKFAPGHDAKVKQMILGVEREVIKQKDLPETLRFLKFKREPVGPEGALVLQVQNSPVKIPGRERQEAE